MTPAAFRAWRLSLGLSLMTAARMLGVSLATVKRYQAGTTRIPGPVELAVNLMSEREGKSSKPSAPKKLFQP